jgi:hypothetical protein
MTDTSTATATGGGIQAATEAFEAILSGSEDQQTKDTKKAPQDDEPTVAAHEDDEVELDEIDEGEADEGEESQESEDEESEDESDDDEADEDDAGSEPIYTVKVDGKEIEVPASELIKGYSRNADYTRKTQELAAHRKQVEAVAQETVVLREQYAHKLAQVEEILKSSEPAEPNWAELRDTDPIEFAAQWAEHQRRQALRAQLEQEKQVVYRQQEQQRMYHMQQTLEAGRQALLDAIPEWKDEAKARADRALIRDYGKKAGFSDEELATVADPRAVIILRKAMKYDALLAKRRDLKPVKKGATPLKPGAAASTTTRQTSALKDAKKRLAKSGSTRDAAELFKFVL